MSRVDRCTEIVKKLKSIEATCCVNNWNGYGADPIPQNVISIVKKMLPFLNKDVEIFPTADQSIQLEIDIVGEGYFECVIQKDGSIEFFSDPTSGEAPTVAEDNNVPVKQPDPITGLVPCWCGGVVEQMDFHNGFFYHSKVECLECGIEIMRAGHTIEEAHDMAKEAWDAAMGYTFPPRPGAIGPETGEMAPNGDGGKGEWADAGGSYGKGGPVGSEDAAMLWPEDVIDAINQFAEDTNVARSPWVKTSDRLPTEADADNTMYWVLATTKRNNLPMPEPIGYIRANPDNYPLWMPIPPLPEPFARGHENGGNREDAAE